MANLNDLQSWPIAISAADWPGAVATAKTFFSPQAGVDCFVNAQDWLSANNLVNGPLPMLPVDSSRPYQPWAMRPSISAQLPALIFAVDAQGNPVVENFTPASGGSVGGNPPETFVQPGTGTPTLTMQVLGGGSFANFVAEYGGWFKNGIPRFTWANYTQESVHTPNFAAGGFAQLPVGWYLNEVSGPATWDRRYVPYITDDKKIRFCRVQDVIGLGKFNAPVITAPAAIQYRNDGAATAAVIAALQAAGFTGTALGDAVNKTARMVL